MTSQDRKTANTLLVFDAQLICLTGKTLQKLRSSLLSTANCAWIIDVVAGLPNFWKTTSATIPKLQDDKVSILLEDLHAWVRHGSFTQASLPFPNVLLTPITVIVQLVQFVNYLNNEGLAWEDLPGTHETSGFCTGLLSAFAVSSSASSGDFKKRGAAAIRLGLLAGAVVDHQNQDDNGTSDWTSTSVGWSSQEQKNHLDEVMDRASEMYPSVTFDENRITLTAPRMAMEGIIEDLTRAGLSLVKMDLHGRFHSGSHRDDVKLLVDLCDTLPAVQLPDAAELVLSTKDNAHGANIEQGRLHRAALEGILSTPCNWYGTCDAALSALSKRTSPRVICFGLARPIPPTLGARLGIQTIYAQDYWNTTATTGPGPLGAAYTYPKAVSGEEVAVIGMACKTAGADDLEEFWQVLCKAESQHTEVKDGSRFDFKTAYRGEGDLKKKWFGNFIADVDAFDHKFWRKSPREAASTDPQQRLMMSVALQAVIQSGYFHASTLENHHIGCYLGIGNVDYEENINHHEPTAFMATGNLRSFIAGKISHALGWTGPAMTIDTACSSSGVAVHQACKAILSGECTAALAGGAAIMTSPRMFQDLAAASFLSPTGPCKSFDAAADGYCRGDGVGAVLLKKMSQAVKDGDQIFGVIASTAVYQNQNCTAITVPNALSLSSLFGDVAKKALVSPSEVTFVEAHGTGTQVGDPAEWEGIRRVYGGQSRTDTLAVGSVKSVVGHTEGAAGIISLIKVLLMMHQGTTTPQSNFKTINPALNLQPADNMEVSTRLQPWDSAFRAAMINSYGASGSNASMLVTQAPRTSASLAVQYSSSADVDRSHPFWLCGLDERSVQAYAAKLLGVLMSHGLSTEGRSVANLAFNVARQTNRWLPRTLIISCTSTDDLVSKLSSYINGDPSVMAMTRTVTHPDTRPVILCFGGQVSTHVGLDKELYHGIKLLRENLDQCDSIIRSAGLGSIFPRIFQRETIEDPVELQIALFSLQYATAKSWLDCGLQVTAVVGHSFGELTALAVSGVLTLDHAIHLVAGRSKIILNAWGAERGVMLAVEGDLTEIERLLSTSSASSRGAGVACFNGPTSFTLAGPTAAIKAFEDTVMKISSPLRMKRLNVSHAFHSTLVEPLEAQLEELGGDLHFKKPSIPLERATRTPTHNELDSRFVADHIRNAVFFHQAVERLWAKYPNAVWLEAGSQSTITSMAKRALGSPAESHFQPMNVTSDHAWGHLVDATMNLWKEGINVPFWPHHSTQTADYAPLLLPPYQFEKVSHWLGRKPPLQPQVGTTLAPVVPERQRGLWAFAGYTSSNNTSARFRIHTLSDEFAELQSGLEASVPLSVQLYIVAQAHLSLLPEPTQESFQSKLHDVQSRGTLCVDSAKSFWLYTEPLDANAQAWKWQILEEMLDGATTLCSAGELVFQMKSRQHETGFEICKRLVDHRRCKTLLEDPEMDTGLQGRSIYQTLHPVEKNRGMYKGLQKVTCKGNECAARLVKMSSRPHQADVFLADGFCQVPTIFVNCMVECDVTSSWALRRIEQWIRSTEPPESDSFDIYSRYHRDSESEWIGDVFVFDARTGKLAEVVLGLHYQQEQSTPQHVQPPPTAGHRQTEPQQVHLLPFAPTPTALRAQLPKEAQPHEPSTTTNVAAAESLPNNISGRVFDVLADLSGIDATEIRNDTELPDIGIDSLMSMELARDIEKIFDCSLVLEDMNEVTDVQSLVFFIQKSIGMGDGGAQVVSPSSATVDSTSPSSASSQTNGAKHFTPSSSAGHSDDGLTVLPQSLVWKAFQDSKALTDEYISQYGFAEYSHSVMPKQTELCVVHILDAFDQLGSSLRSTKPGQKLGRVKYHPRHERFVTFIYDSILKEAGVINIENGIMTRTDAPLPTKSAKTLLEELLHEAPDHSYDHRLTYLAGCRLAEVLNNTCDGVHLLFSSSEGREMVTGMYSQSPVNVVWIKQIEAILGNLLTRLDPRKEPLRILELGAGTGGTTAKMVAILVALGVPVEYTVTDLSPSLVAAARKRFKGLGLLKYQVYDIEKPPSQELRQSQHIVLATNCVHATRSLVTSTGNVHQLLRPDGFLLMLEMTETIPWIDLVFGILDGWWLFEDGREHALVSPETWKETLQSVGYGSVDWTAGERPEASIQRVIIAMAS
ncbi:hypothetical protein LTR08_003689 [Meristemomyces frigidus]|nr:hypothetical protein LTR08_003689 [Meristemomyces frigidus]